MNTVPQGVSSHPYMNFRFLTYQGSAATATEATLWTPDSHPICASPSPVRTLSIQQSPEEEFTSWASSEAGQCNFADSEPLHLAPTSWEAILHGNDSLGTY